MDSRSIIRENIQDLFTRFNNDFFFKSCNISFSRRFEHFIDRLHERKFDQFDVIRALAKHISDKKCEIIYCCHLTSPPIRLNITSKNFVICFNIFVDTDNNKTQLKLRTITENTGRTSRVSTFNLQ